MYYNTVRKGCHDIWNAFMLDGAVFSEHDIPFCPTTATSPPGKLISFADAKTLFNAEMAHNNLNFRNEAFVHFCIDDQKFDGKKAGIWADPFSAIEIIKHFAGAITPDFSTYMDFPDPLNRYNTFRMRTFGLWLANNDIPVINNVRWGGPETWEYCFDGLPTDSILFIGTVASNLRNKESLKIHTEGLRELVQRKRPQIIVVYGSSNYPIYKELSSLGIKIVTFQSDTAAAFERRSNNE